MKTTSLSRVALLSLTTSLIALGAPASAQLDEIIVTAQKKEENLQDVPIAITAFDFETIQTQRIEGLEDIGRVAPGVYVTPNSADPNGVQVNIRGIGILDPQVGQDSRVAIYQDGVYIGKTQGLAFDMPDLARVEILKGPQGTLYGRNTVAGAVNLVSKRPDTTKSEGRIGLEYGNFNHMKINGAANMPMNDKAAIRVSGSYLQRDGWVENNGLGTDFGGEEKYGFRGVLGINLAPNVTTDFALDYNKVKKESLYYQAYGTGAAPFAAPITPFDDGRADETVTFFDNQSGDSETKGASLITTWDIAENQQVKATLAYREADTSRFVALLPNANPTILNAITGGFNQALSALPGAFAATGTPLRADFGTAFTGNPPEAGLFLSQDGGQTSLDHEQFSAEITYNGSTKNGMFEYTGGAFFYDEQTGTGPVTRNLDNANDYLFVLAAFSPALTAGIDQGLAAAGTGLSINGFLDTVDLAPTFPGIQSLPAESRGPIPAAGVLFGQTFNPTPGVSPTALALLSIVNAQGIAPVLASARQSAANTLDIDTQAFALYGQLTWNLTEDFRVTGGLRYSDESKSGYGQSYSPFFVDTTSLTGEAILPNISEYDDEVLDPALIVEYDVNEDFMIYASYKESYRAGGFNAAAVGLRIAGETFGSDFNFDRENITAYEGGLKSTFMGGRARVNAAAFYYDFEDVQTTISLNPLIATSRAVVNTTDEVYGFEVDGLFALTEALTARGSYTFVDGEAGDVVNPLTNAVDARDELQGTPENSYLMALDYDGTWDGRGVFANVTYSHKDGVLRVPESNVRLSSQDLVSATAGVEFDFGGNKATLSVWGQNLTDDEYTIDSLPFDTFSYNVDVYGQPRSYGVALGYTF